MSDELEPPRTILVVEDEPDVLLIMRSLLRELTSGFEIVTVSNGGDAMAQINRGRIALLITDYNMPGANGLELLRRVRAVSPDTRVIMVTAYPSSDLERQVRAAGATAFLPKPFGLDQLVEAMQRALGQ
jgi:two-component system, response regulator, stage 0 sporulation protein F